MAAFDGAKFDGLENDILKWATGVTPTIISGTAITPYIGLFTTFPTDDNGTTGAVEVSTSGTAYARVNTASGKWGTPANGTVTNSAGAITFPTATASWGTVVGWGLWSVSTAGTPLYGGLLTTSKAVASGDTASFAVSAFSLSEA